MPAHRERVLRPLSGRGLDRVNEFDAADSEDEIDVGRYDQENDFAASRGFGN